MKVRLLQRVINGFNKYRKLASKRLIYSRLSKSKQHDLYHGSMFWFALNTPFRDAELQSTPSVYKIFGVNVDYASVDWHKDYISGFQFPLQRVWTYKLKRSFNQGNDIKFPWEVSRFYLGIRLAKYYIATRDVEYYKLFKKSVLSWIDSNPYLYGVNWICPMEIAIRSTNWIVALNLFGEIYVNDTEFQTLVCTSLYQQGELISRLPEIGSSNHTNNHTTADYMGLLFIAIFLRSNHDACRWIRQAMNGLENCMDYQIHNDGTDFENSVNYHRLVLEFFAFSAIAANTIGMRFSDHFYAKLFRMFEFVAAYLDCNGNAPQIGDNDSGRALIFYQGESNDHSYLLDIGEFLFEYKFNSMCKIRDKSTLLLFPKIDKINPEQLGVIFRNTTDTSVFPDWGLYFLKNETLFVSINLGSRGGAHCHIDNGSFTLSYSGIPIVVDPGSYTYTRSKSLRDHYRALTSHNVVSIKGVDSFDLSKFDFFSLSYDSSARVHEFTTDRLDFSIDYSGHQVRRKFTIGKSCLSILDTGSGILSDRIHFHPAITILADEPLNSPDSLSIFYNANLIGYLRLPRGSYAIQEYDYSGEYSSKQQGVEIIIESKSPICIEIRFIPTDSPHSETMMNHCRALDT